MNGLKKCYQRKRPPQVKPAKKRSAIRRDIVENLQKANIASKEARTEVEQIMAELLQEYREGKLSKSQNAMLKNILILEKIGKALEKIPNELNKFEELTIRDYKEHCTIDGINDLFAAKSHLERCVWIIAIIACFVLAGFLCSKARDEWYESIETKTKYFRSENLSYPDVIICPDLIYNQDQFDKFVKDAQNYVHEFYSNKSLRNETDYEQEKMTKDSIIFSTMVNPDEYPHIYLPLLSRNARKILELVDEKDEKISREFLTEMVDIQKKNNLDQISIWVLRRINNLRNLGCVPWIRKQSLLFCIIADFIKKIDPMKMSYNCSSFLLTYYPSELWDVEEEDDFDYILGLNLTNREILTKHIGIKNFCDKSVKESFDFRHKCYRFNSEEIFPSPKEPSIGIIFPDDIEHGLIGEKGFWFSIVDKTKELNSEKSSSQAIDDNTSSIYSSLSWHYLRPGVHTISIDATRNLILRSSDESRCDDRDIISNYNYTRCIEQTCDTISKKKWDCILPIKKNSKVDKKYKMCMEMPNDRKKYYAECVKKCEEYCDFWTYLISDVKSEYFNETIANKFLNITKSDLQNRFYIRLLYNLNRYGLSEQFYKITWTQFISNIGGTTGLCIGFSLMSFCQILLYMTMVIFGRVKKNRRTRNSQNVGNHDTVVIRF